MMPDLGKDAPVCVNESGGKQSTLDVSLVRVPPHALIAVGKVLASGAKKYPDDADGTPNWHRIDVRDHLNHMLTHAMAYLAGDTQDDHLEHMACRALMALERKYLDEQGSSTASGDSPRSTGEPQRKPRRRRRYPRVTQMKGW